jgi:glycosyltransferase involved in cell wall biosynthesis
MKKNLLIFIPHIGGGGVEKNFFLLSNFLSKKINSLTVITINKEFKKNLDKRIHIISPKSDRWKNSHTYMKYLICIVLLIKTLLANRQYLILSFQANWYSIIISKLFFVKVVSRSNTAPEGWSNNKIKKILYKFVLNLADEIIVNSLEFKKSIKKKFNISSICIYNPIDKDNVIKKSRETLQFNFFKKNELKLINVGRCTDQKNQILILKAIKHLNDKIPLKLLIAGRGEEFKKLKSYIKSNNLKKNIKLLDFIQNPYKYINKADVVILSSNYEGLPNILLEAQCLKKIILSTQCPAGPKEILLSGKAGTFFKMNDYKDLAKKICFINDNKAKIKKKTEIGYKNLKRFNQETNLNRYYLVLKKYLL